MKAPLYQFAAALLVCLLVIGGYVAWYFTVVGTRDAVASLAADVAAKEAESVRASSDRASAGALAEDEAFVSAHLLAPGDIVGFLERFEATGKTVGATVSVASVDDTQEAQGSIDLSFSVTGSFDAVLRALGALEHGPYASRTKTVSLSQAGDGWEAAGVMTVAIVATSTP